MRTKKTKNNRYLVIKMDSDQHIVNLECAERLLLAATTNDPGHTYMVVRIVECRADTEHSTRDTTKTII